MRLLGSQQAHKTCSELESVLCCGLAALLDAHASRAAAAGCLDKRRVLHDCLEQLCAAQRISKRHVALGRLVAVVELCWPLAVHVVLALHPVNGLEELGPAAASLAGQMDR